MGVKQIKRLYSSGGVVFKKDDKSKVKWLIIKPAGRNEWRLPKGLIEKSETSVKAAMREVEEESGVKAAIKEKVGIIQYFYSQDGEKILKEVIFFLMEYLEGDLNNHDEEVDKAKFVTFDEAYKRLTYETEKDILSQAVGMLKFVE